MNQKRSVYNGGSFDRIALSEVEEIATSHETILDL